MSVLFFVALTVPTTALGFIGVLFKKLFVIFNNFSVSLRVKLDPFLFKVLEPRNGEAAEVCGTFQLLIVFSDVAVIECDSGGLADVEEVEGLEEIMGVQTVVSAIPANAAENLCSDCFAEAFYGKTAKLFGKVKTVSISSLLPWHPTMVYSSRPNP